MRSIDHGSSDDDRSSGHQRETSSSNKRQKRGDDDTSISPRQSSRQATQNAYEAVAEAEKKQQQRQQKLEKAQAAAARTKSAVEKARSEEQFDTLARQQEKLEKKQQKLEKQKLKLEEQQRKLNEERKMLKEIPQEEPTFGAKSSTKPPSSPTQIGSRMKMTTISPNQRRRRTRRVFNGTRMLKGYDSPSSDSDDGVGSMKSTKVDTEVVDEHDGNDSEDSDDVITSSQPSRRRQLSKQTSEDVGDEDKKIESNDDDDDDDEIKPHTPRLRRGIVRPSGGKEEAEEGKYDQDDSKKDQNQLDLEDDLEFLEDSAVKDTRTRGTVVNSAKAKRMAYLEQLRQRRSGTKPEEREVMEPSEDEDSEEDTDEDKAETRSGQSVRKSRDYDNEREPIEMIDLDQDDEDFIVEGDAEDLVGVPDNEVALPFEFSRHRYKRNKEYFRDVVEWMVHNKLNPAFPRDDAVYKAAFEKVNDEVMGLAASQLISSVWTLDFRRSLEARPIAEFKLFAGESGCDACKRSTHTATYEVAFKGKPYSLRTLEPLTDGEGKSDDEDGDDEEGNDDGSDSSSDDSESSSDEDDEKAKKEEEDNCKKMTRRMRRARRPPAQDE
ncbi:hypothetical protein AAP_02000 [Ascosphaera apis ARSEF 7405]|uniref:DUF4211 domain-containing protein n=1 Tax=Ascosphaera apis ARSEF 7405 TaxID=392613 RepID=A0A168AGQ3_9EURO|nr:hypothetical protein AAP_02000 [Ascosphaera apis ARSEF 7405]